MKKLTTIFLTTLMAMSLNSCTSAENKKAEPKAPAQETAKEPAKEAVKEAAAPAQAEQAAEAPKAEEPKAADCPAITAEALKAMVQDEENIFDKEHEAILAALRCTKDDEIIALINSQDQKVAKIACYEVGSLYNEKFVAPLTAIINNPAQKDLHGKCMHSLVTMWLDYPAHEHHSEAAYKATMEYFQKKPRNNLVPAYDTFSYIHQVANDNSQFDKWKEQATWFKADEFVAVMSDILKDKQANWLSKNPALRAVFAFGGKAELDKLSPVIKELDDMQITHIYKELQEKAGK